MPTLRYRGLGEVLSRSKGEIKGFLQGIHQKLLDTILLLLFHDCLTLGDVGEKPYPEGFKNYLQIVIRFRTCHFFFKSSFVISQPSGPHHWERSNGLQDHQSVRHLGREEERGSTKKGVTDTYNLSGGTGPWNFKRKIWHNLSQNALARWIEF